MKPISLVLWALVCALLCGVTSGSASLTDVGVYPALKDGESVLVADENTTETGDQGVNGTPADKRELLAVGIIPTQSSTMSKTSSRTPSETRYV